MKALGRLGWTLSRISAATGLHRVTAGAYLGAPEFRAEPGPAARRDGKTDDCPAGGVHRPWRKTAPSPQVSTDSGPVRAPSASACEIYREVIAAALARGRNAMAIWQDLVDDHGFPARYASLRRSVRSLRDAPTAEARVVITTAPGEEAQVDYGEGPMVRDPATGAYSVPC